MRGRIVTLLALSIVILFVIIIAGCGIGTYNSLVNKSTAVDNQWAQVQVQYQRRFDLIPNLVESVKGIFNQEQEVFGKLADALTKYAGAQQSGTTSDQVAAANQLQSALARLLLVIENYPDLRSQENVTQLMDELAGTENRVSVERQRFNTATTDYNRLVRRFPSNVFAGMFGYETRSLFEAPPETEKPPKVEF